MKREIVTLFMSHLLESLPFLLIGIIVSSSLMVFLNLRLWIAKLPQNPLQLSLLGTIIGILFPFGVYSNIPIVRRLLIARFPISLVISFLFSSALLNSGLLWASLRLWTQQFSLWTMILAISFCLSLILGIIFALAPSRRNLMTPLPIIIHSGSYLVSEEVTATTRFIYRREKIRLLLDNIIKESLELTPILILACLVISSVQFFVPQNQLFPLMLNPQKEILGSFLMGVWLSNGDDSTLKTAYSFTSSLSNSAVIGLFFSSLCFNLKQLFLLLSVLRWRIYFYLLIISGEFLLLWLFLV